MEQKRKRNIRIQQSKNLLKCIGYTFITGMFVGTIVSIYNYLANIIAKYSHQIYSFLGENLVYIPIALLILVGLAILMSLIQKISPESVGSGIPQVKAALKGFFILKWLRDLFASFFSSMISFFVGLSMGSEGPSILIGASASNGMSKMLGINPYWDRYMIRGGASAGIATAFNAPMTGIVYGLEESHDYFSPLILIATLCSVLASILVARLINSALGIHSLIFEIGATYKFTVSNFYFPVLLGVFIGIAGIIFNKLILATKSISERIKLPSWIRLVILFLIIGIANIFFIEGAGSGHHLILAIGNMKYNWEMLLILLVVKTVFTILCFSSGATGGLFLPILALGATLGALSANLFEVMGMSPQAYNTIVICAMAAFLGAFARTPLTAVFAVLETTRFEVGFFTPIVTVVIAFMIIQVSQTESFYDFLRDKYIAKSHEKKEKEQITLNLQLEKKSFVANKIIKDILWPPNTFVLHIIRNGEEIPVKGHTILEVGDNLVIQTTTFSPNETVDTIQNMCKAHTNTFIFLKIYKEMKIRYDIWQIEKENKKILEKEKFEEISKRNRKFDKNKSDKAS